MSTHLIIAITLLIIIVSNAQITEIICTNGKEATVTAGNKLQIHSVLCSDADMIYIDITYNDYNNNWFGIVFSENMYGDALVYTIGKSNTTGYPRAAALYAYTNTASSPRSNGVVYQSTDDWTEHFSNESNGIRIIYKKPLSDTPWSTSTETIKVGYAIGDDLELKYHENERNDDGKHETLNFAATSPATTTTSTSNTGGKGCDAQDLLPTTTTMNDFTISLFINCVDNTVTVTIKYSSYNNNWFGIVFSNNMLGNALIYTTGISDETQREEGLYPYTLGDRVISAVQYDGEENNWIKVKATDENGVFVVEYKQDLNKTNSFSRETESVPVRWAFGSSLVLARHDTPDGRASSTGNLDLLKGKSTEIADDLSLETAHGIIMWITWAVLASIGIMSSAFRFLYPQGPKWFYVHRGVQCVVVILNIIGFIIAIVFTEQKGKQHFANPHMIIGLVVTILSTLQPINAYFRTHPPSDGWPNSVKPMKRIIWEYIHKISGYSAWILGCVAAMLGMQILGEDMLSYLHMFLWCGLLLVAYVVLFVIGYNKSKYKKQMVVVNEGPGGGDADDEGSREQMVGNESP